MPLDQAWEALRRTPTWPSLDLTEAERDAFVADAASLVEGYFQLEDPDTVDAVGVELTLEADVAGLRLRGIIDRLDVNRRGELEVVDYKTGRIPSVNQEQQRLGGVQFYALLCEQVLGRQAEPCPAHVPARTARHRGRTLRPSRTRDPSAHRGGVVGHRAGL